MITLVEATNSQGALLGLPLDDVSNGVVVEEIEGLDPVDATIVSTSFATLDGVQYQSSRRNERNIKLKLGMEPDYAVDTVRTIRKRLYRHFMPKSPVGLRFYDSDGLVVDIAGRVESAPAPLFAEDPEMTVSIICFDPDFVEDQSVIVPGNTVATDTEFVLEYDGTVETGIEFVISPNRDLPQFTIYHRPPDGSLRSLEFQYPLASEDVLTISTIPGAKGATLTQSGQDGSVLYGISPQSNWIELQPGSNNIRVYAEGAAIPYTIEYTNKYGGL